MGVEEDLVLLKNRDWDKVSADPEWRRELLALDYFHNVLMCMTDQNGWSIQGCSFSEKGTNTMLCVKATEDGIPQVAFVTERFPTRCVIAFCRMWLENRVRWYPDKFR